MVLSSPLYEIPMDDRDLLLLGRIAVVWTQMEGTLSDLRYNIAPYALEEFYAIERLTMGPRLDDLEKAARDNPDPATDELIRQTITAVRACLADRNAIAHGLAGWAWVAADQGHEAIFFNRGRTHRLPVSQLPRLHEQIIQAHELAYRTSMARGEHGAGQLARPSNAFLGFSNVAPDDPAGPQRPPPQRFLR